jgi:hypothetical protein
MQCGVCYAAAVRSPWWLVSIGLSIVACYDVDRLRSERDRPLDAASGEDAAVVDASDDATDAPVVEAGPPADAGLCPSPLPAPSAGLIAFYPLDEKTGQTVTDCAGGALDGVVIAPTPAWTGGRNAGGLRLSTSAGCVQLGTAPTATVLDFTGSFSVTAWINVTTFPGPTAGYIAGKTKDPDLGGWRIATGNNAVDGTVALATNVRLTVSAPLSGNTWAHVALVVIAGGSMELYIDGTMRATKPGVPSVIKADPAATARLGCRSDGTQAFDGIVDDVRIFSRALTPAEVAAVAQ